MLTLKSHILKTTQENETSKKFLETGSLRKIFETYKTLFCQKIRIWQQFKNWSFLAKNGHLVNWLY